MEHMGTTFWGEKTEKDPRIMMLCETILLRKVIWCHHHPFNFMSDTISLLFTLVSILPS